MLLRTHRVFLALDEQQVIGTASLDGRAVRTMFVAPQVQRTGVSQQLMAATERAARSAGVDVLVVTASLKPEDFYAKLGLRAVRDDLRRGAHDHHGAATELDLSVPDQIRRKP